MRISLKVIGLFWIGLFLIIGGLLFNAYSKLKPEIFIALLTEQVKKNYPQSELNVGKVSYRFSLDFNLNLRDVHLRQSGKLIGSMREVELKVPWWLLLFNRGNAQINLSDLDIFIDHDEHQAILATQPAKTDNKIIRVSLPSYLADAKYTLRAKLVSVRDIDNGRRYFTISKLLVREFQYGKNSAFEINIPIAISHNKVQYSSDLWLFGDITPEQTEWKLNYRGEFRTRETNDKFQIEDLVINGVSSFIPNSLAITSNVNLLIDKKQIGNGNFLANQKTLGINLYFSRLPLSYFGLAYEEIKNPYLEKFEGNAAGEIKFEKNLDTLSSSVAGKLIFDGDLRLSEKDKIAGKWKVGFQDNRWDVSFMSPRGEASFFRRSVVNLKENTVTQYSEELGFSGLDLNQAIAPVMSLSNFMSLAAPSYFTSTISYKQCLMGDKIYDGIFRYGFQPDQKFYQGEIGDSKSALRVNYSNKDTNNQIEINFNNFDWNTNYHFLTPYFKSNAGKIEGKVAGRWRDTWETGQWLIQLSGTDMVGTEGKMVEFLSKTASIFEIDPNKTTKQILNLSIKDSILNLNSLMLENVESAKITGSLSTKQKSTLTLSYPKNKKFKPLKKEVIEAYWLQKEEI